MTSFVSCYSTKLTGGSSYSHVDVSPLHVQGHLRHDEGVKAGENMEILYQGYRHEARDDADEES